MSLDYNTLQAHLQQVAQGSNSIDIRLFDEFRRLGLVNTLSIQERGALAVQLYQLLPSLQHDPTPINELLEALLHAYPLDGILQIDPPVDFAAGLDVHATPFHSLTLSLLAKGETDIAPARRLATTQPDVFAALLRLWLCVEDTGTADKAYSVVLGLLKADRELDGSGILPSASADPTGIGSDNPIWKRIFRDPDVYSIMYSATSLQDSTIRMSKSRRTIAQARLLQLIPELGQLDWNAATGSHIPQVEADHGLKHGQGLLEYAAVRMVDISGDVLMHRSLIDFFGNLLLVFRADDYAARCVLPPSRNLTVPLAVLSLCCCEILSPP